jgi:hypothetical protein
VIKTAKQKKHQKPHGHYCKVCGQHKSNEKFSGKGHAAHICKQCASMPIAERNGEMTFRKIEGMAFRHLSEAEIKWLRGKMNDADPAIRDAARSAHGIKFPHYERNMSKKGLTARALEFFIHGTVWDEYGDEVPVNMRFFVDNNGAMRRIDYDAPENERETSIHIGQTKALKFLKAVVQQLNAPFWNEDYDLNGSDDDDFDFGIDGDNFFSDEDDVDGSSEPEEAPDENRKSVWTLRLVLNKGGETTQTSYREYIQDEPQDLFWSLMEWFEPEEEFDDEDFEGIEDEEGIN